MRLSSLEICGYQQPTWVEIDNDWFRILNESHMLMSR